MNTLDLLKHDKKYLPGIVAGMDEAGRGPLAGPVVAACCIMPLDKMIDGINDSKQIPEAKREALYEEIIKTAVCWAVGEADNFIIDEINILNATRRAMRDAANGLSLKPSIILVDAVKNIDISVNCESIIKGDEKSYNIAAASIIAKVHRDRLMREMDKKFSGYGFITNKGYGTKGHMDAIRLYGKTSIHRESFLKKLNEHDSIEAKEDGAG